MFWEKIVELCNTNGTSPTALCEKLGYSNATATKWKKGAIPRSTTIQRIADYFGVTSDYLLGKTDKKEKAPANSESNFTEAEIALIEMYRGLDDAGKITVGTVLKKEYDRTQRSKGLIPSTVAARSADGSETVHTEYLPDLSAIPADDTDL